MPPPPDERLTPLGALAPILLCIIFGANAVAIKVSLAGVGTFTAAGLRFTIAAAAIALWARFTGRPFRIASPDQGPLLLLCLLFTAQLSLLYLGLSKTLASRGALVVNTMPFFVLIFAHFFIPGDRITLRKVVGMGFGFGGVAMALMDGSQPGSGINPGDYILLLATLIWGVNAVYTKAMIHRFRPFQLVLYPMLCAAPIQLMEGYFWDEVMFFKINGSIVTAVIYQSLITAALGFVIWSSLLRRYGATTLHSFVFIMPISGVTASNLILNEPLSVTLIAAVVLVATGIAIINIKAGQTPPSLPVGRSY